ncbi:hypothetical protein SLNSH_10765 [Alsobacter soli]|uniref:Uncharacterized protein n=1 Tax=Alsobacter soli TaxID=2109933 RepID=A0A2T1HTF7_9HYPH|nr:hypothetical protein [Alsobacter soli]PSC04927.1 hypothetical protein SLNSH_10765 [Alsobacter soli]
MSAAILPSSPRPRHLRPTALVAGVTLAGLLVGALLGFVAVEAASYWVVSEPIIPPHTNSQP